MANRDPGALAGTTIRLGSGESGRVRMRGFQLDIVAGPDKGRAVRFTSSTVRVGKDPTCDLTLADPSVSRIHLQIEEEPDGYVLRDLGSTNGTRVNGTPVREAVLTPGALIDMGGTSLRFEAYDRMVPVLPATEDRFHGLIGRSAAMRELFGHLKLAAPTMLSVLLLGETGCGKEVAARALHEASPRANGPFTVFDCGSVDRELVGAALFGHSEGAYTGAAASRKGAFQAAHGGTLFIDEVGELPVDLQPRLLRALERREVQPLGTDKVVKVDVRVVAATHRDLDAMVAAGTFRQDLLFRLSGLVLQLPPLRARRDDIALLAEHMLSQLQPGARLTPAASALLEGYAWPGNVRELRHAMERAAAFAQGSTVDAAHVRLGPVRMGQPQPPAAAVIASADAPVLSLQDAELAALKTALRASNGNKSHAARLLGIARKTLREKMARYGLGDPGED